MPKLYTRKDNRLSGYNYSNSGAYYVTVCSMNRKCIFGDINCVGGRLALPRIKLSKIGEIINCHWEDIPRQYDNVKLDEYVIMPNHIHGILFINKRDGASPSPTYLGGIIGAFKSRCTVDYLKYIRENKLDASAKIWQRNYHDHIIRNGKSLGKIREYIRNNPLNWDYDVENPNRIDNIKIK